MALFPERQRLLEDRTTHSQSLRDSALTVSKDLPAGGLATGSLKRLTLSARDLPHPDVPISRSGQQNRGTRVPLQPLQCRRTRQYCPQTPAPQAEMTYLQVSNLKRADFLLALHVPDLDEPAHIPRHHQLRVAAERGACDRILVTCRQSERSRFVLMNTERVNNLLTLLQTCAFKQHASVRHAPHERPVVLSAGHSQTVADWVQTNTEHRTCGSRTAFSKS